MHRLELSIAILDFVFNIECLSWMIKFLNDILCIKYHWILPFFDTNEYLAWEQGCHILKSVIFILDILLSTLHVVLYKYKSILQSCRLFAF